MTYIFIAYAFVVLSVAYLLMAWFVTEMPMLVYEILRKLGYKRKSKLWTVIPAYSSDEYVRETWEIAVALHEPHWLSALLSCRYCLSVHLSFWSSIVAYVAAYATGTHLPILFVPFCTATAPALANLIYSATVRFNEE